MALTINDVYTDFLHMLNDSDTSDYPSTRVMPYLNDGIQFIQSVRIGARDPEVISTVTVTTPAAKPVDFFSFVPATAAYPIDASGSTLTRLAGAPSSVVVKYSKKVTRVTSTADTFPLPDEYAGFVASYANIRIREDNGNFDATAQMKILQSDIEAFVKAKGG